MDSLLLQSAQSCLGLLSFLNCLNTAGPQSLGPAVGPVWGLSTGEGLFIPNLHPFTWYLQTSPGSLGEDAVTSLASAQALG